MSSNICMLVNRALFYCVVLTLAIARSPCKIYYLLPTCNSFIQFTMKGSDVCEASVVRGVSSFALKESF